MLPIDFTIAHRNSTFSFAAVVFSPVMLSTCLPQLISKGYHGLNEISISFEQQDLTTLKMLQPTMVKTLTSTNLANRSFCLHLTLVDLVVARVFQMKRKAVVEYIYKHGIFGKAATYVYIIEFQKRGLPHMHCLIFLREPYKLLTPEAIDSCISACWPDPEREPLLFETVKKCMVHGPCGALNSNAPCMVDGKCSKNYPKNYQESTSMDPHGYPLYF